MFKHTAHAEGKTDEFKESGDTGGINGPLEKEKTQESRCLPG